MYWCQTRYTAQIISVIGDPVDENNMTRANPEFPDLILGVDVTTVQAGHMSGNIATIQIYKQLCVGRATLQQEFGRYCHGIECDA